MKVSTINVLLIPKYGDTEIHSYLYTPKTMNRSTAQAMDQFRRLIVSTCDTLSITQLTEEEMAAAMEREYWDSDQGIMIEIQRSVD